MDAEIILFPGITDRPKAAASIDAVIARYSTGPDSAMRLREIFDLLHLSAKNAGADDPEATALATCVKWFDWIARERLERRGS